MTDGTDRRASAPASDGLDPRQVSHWVFDLDNTLYPASTNLFRQIDVRMKAFISDAFGLHPDDAFHLQKKYYREHGTTLRGLMLNHDVDPDDFLAFVHEIDHSVLDPDPGLDQALLGLPGQKLIYTNGSTRHAERVIDALGVAHHFTDIFDIKAGGYIPKPDPAPYQSFVAAHGVTPQSAVMLEDSFKNLGPAAALGMTTVWVRHDEHVPEDHDDLSHCDIVIDDVKAWLADLAARVDQP